MSTNFVPCPNNAKCGYQTHDPSSDSYRQCVATASVRSDATGISSDSGCPCVECGVSTKRTSGYCRRCDPARSNKKRPKPTTDKPEVLVDRSADPIPVKDIRQCEYEFVPMYRTGGIVEGEFRQCRNAVRVPAVRCHCHGGDRATSLGRSVAKATAEAGRGECFPLSDKYWDQAASLAEEAYGLLAEMLENDTELFARLHVAARSGHHRFSLNNQGLLAAQLIGRARRELVHELGKNPDIEAVFARTLELLEQPIFTEAKWRELGREVNHNATPLSVVWYQPGGMFELKQRDGESDQEFTERCGGNTQGYARSKVGAHTQFLLSDTTGEPYTQQAHPLQDPGLVKAGSTPPEHVTQHLVDIASDMGIQVDLVDHKPSHGYAYWAPSENRIVVWKGVGGGNPAAVAHAMAHELGHAWLGHSTDAGIERETPDREAAAESFAYLVMAHNKVDTRDLSSWYITGWRKDAGVEMERGGGTAWKSACNAYSEYVNRAAMTGQQNAA